MPATLDISALKALPAVNVTVGGDTYTGVNLWTLLNSIGLTPSAGSNPTLSMYAAVTGSDGYRMVVSLGEISPSFANNGTLVAYAIDGEPVNTDGATRLIVPGEVGHARWISNLAAIEVLAASAQ